MNTKTITFIKDTGGWYADIPNHTRAQNAMVMGADKLCEALSGGHNKVAVDVSFSDTLDKANTPSENQYVVSLKRIEHDPHGATYWLKGKLLQGSLLKMAWLCNVTHDALGVDHPKHMFVTNIQCSDI